MRIGRTIGVRWQMAGFHRWAGAQGVRSYLVERHRHLFWIEVELAVVRDDREVEFHDLLDWSRERLASLAGAGGEFGDRSCEMIAELLGEAIREQWPGRSLAVSVWEDGECGARVRWTVERDTGEGETRVISAPNSWAITR